MATLDTVITNGQILDGSGRPPVRGDVGIADGRIATIGEVPRSGAGQVIDATGLCVAPGFIDLHSHADLTIHNAPAAEACLRQGVTLLQTGNCGFSPFPGADSEALRENVSLLATDLPWDWHDQASYLKSVRDRGPGVNLALQVGHHALRIQAMGAADRAPTAQELDAMITGVRGASACGATGLSFGLIYAPGSFADRNELVALAGVAAAEGMLVSCHMRNETDHLLEAVQEILDVAQHSGCRLQISHLKAMGPLNHGMVARAVELIEAAREDGVDVATDMYPYTASATTLTSRLPRWAMSGGVTELLGRLHDDSATARIEAELAGRMEHEIDPAGIVIADLGHGPDRWAAGRSLSDIAAEWRVHPAQAAVKLIADHEAKVQIVNHSMSEADLLAALSYRYCAVASDGSQLSSRRAGLTHPRSFGTFPRLLARYVREQGVLGLPEAIRRVTSLPATRLGLVDRGRVDVGSHADLVLFDADAVSDNATYANPTALATGVREVLIGGQPAVRDGELTGVRAGSFVHKHT